MTKTDINSSRQVTVCILTSFNGCKTFKNSFLLFKSQGMVTIYHNTQFKGMSCMIIWDNVTLIHNYGNGNVDGIQWRKASNLSIRNLHIESSSSPPPPPPPPPTTSWCNLIISCIIRRHHHNVLYLCILSNIWITFIFPRYSPKPPLMLYLFTKAIKYFKDQLRGRLVDLCTASKLRAVPTT